MYKRFGARVRVGKSGLVRRRPFFLRLVACSLLLGAALTAVSELSLSSSASADPSSTAVATPLPANAISTMSGVGRMSCPSSSWCVAVGSYQTGTTTSQTSGMSPLLLTFSGGQWTALQAPLPSDAVQDLGSPDRLDRISCPTVGWCVASGVYQAASGGKSMFLTLSNGQWSAVGSLAATINDVSCPAVGWCSAVGYTWGSNSQPLWEVLANGSWTSIAVPPPPANGTNDVITDLTSVACWATTECYGVGQYGGTVEGWAYVTEYQNGSITTISIAGAGGSYPVMNKISCRSDGWCAAVGQVWLYNNSDANQETYALFMVEAGGTWSAQEGPRISTSMESPAPDGSNSFDSLSCPTTGWCATVGTTQGSSSSSVDVGVLSNGSWTVSSPPALAGAGSPLQAGGIDCTSVGQCLATGQSLPNSQPEVPILWDLWGGRWTASAPGQLGGTNPQGAGPPTCPQIGQCLFGVGLPDGNSAIETFQFGQTNTSVAVHLSASPIPSGSSATYIASVSPPADAGTVTFDDNGAPVDNCTAVPVDPTTGTATCVTGSLEAGIYPITASYSGDAAYTASGTSPIVDQIVSCPTGITHLASGEPWAVAATTVPAVGEDCPGYWVVTRTGGVTAIGAAPWLGDMSDHALNAAMIGIAATPTGKGYYLLGADGGIFTFGDASFHGSTGSMRLNAPVVAMAVTPKGAGYWLAASDGGIFTFGDAAFYGSMGGQHLNKPVVGMSADSHTGGYWLVASDGGIFTFNTPFYGSMGGQHLNQPVVGMSPQPDGGGYRMVASDGGVFDFGDATFYGSLPGEDVQNPQVTTMAASVDGNGYYLINAAGTIWSFGDAPNLGNA